MTSPRFTPPATPSSSPASLVRDRWWSLRRRRPVCRSSRPTASATCTISSNTTPACTGAMAIRSPTWSAPLPHSAVALTPARRAWPRPSPNNAKANGSWKSMTALQPTLSATNAAPHPARRLIQLDVLRGLAILLVLGRHAIVPREDAGRLAPLAKIWWHIGWTGVDLFFVLSGFLVGGLLLGELRSRGTLDIKRFIIRRGFKIWPAYYTLV